MRIYIWTYSDTEMSERCQTFIHKMPTYKENQRFIWKKEALPCIGKILYPFSKKPFDIKLAIGIAYMCT